MYSLIYLDFLLKLMIANNLLSLILDWVNLLILKVNVIKILLIIINNYAYRKMDSLKYIKNNNSIYRKVIIYYQREK